VVRRPDGGLAVGDGLPGRGAWLCRTSAGCLGRALRHKAFSRALRAPVDDDAVLALGRELGMPADVRGYMDTRARGGNA